MGLVPVLVTSSSTSPSQSSFPASFSLSGFLTLTLIGRCFGIFSTTSRSTFAGPCARLYDSPQTATSEAARAMMTRAAAWRRREGVRRA
jgi:hypothetical protein